MATSSSQHNCQLDLDQLIKDVQNCVYREIANCGEQQRICMIPPVPELGNDKFNYCGQAYDDFDETISIESDILGKLRGRKAEAKLFNFLAQVNLGGIAVQQMDPVEIVQSFSPSRAAKMAPINTSSLEAFIHNNEEEKGLFKFADGETHEFDFIYLHPAIGVCVFEVKYSQGTEEGADKQIDAAKNWIEKLFEKVFDAELKSVCGVHKIVCVMFEDGDNNALIKTYDDAEILRFDGSHIYANQTSSTANSLEEFLQLYQRIKAEQPNQRDERFYQFAALIIAMKSAIALVQSDYMTNTVTNRLEEILSQVGRKHYDEKLEYKKSKAMEKPQALSKQSKTSSRKNENITHVNKKKANEKLIRKNDKEDSSPTVALGNRKSASLSLQDGNKVATKYYLNRDQQRIIRSGKLRIVLRGVSGAGKTLLIQIMAIRSLTMNRSIVVFCPTSLMLFYEQFFQRNSNLESFTVDFGNDSCDAPFSRRILLVSFDDIQRHRTSSNKECVLNWMNIFQQSEYDVYVDEFGRYQGNFFRFMLDSLLNGRPKRPTRLKTASKSSVEVHPLTVVAFSSPEALFRKNPFDETLPSINIEELWPIMHENKGESSTHSMSSQSIPYFNDSYESFPLFTSMRYSTDIFKYFVMMIQNCFCDEGFFPEQMGQHFSRLYCGHTITCYPVMSEEQYFACAQYIITKSAQQCLLRCPYCQSAFQSGTVFASDLHCPFVCGANGTTLTAKNSTCRCAGDIFELFEPEERAKLLDFARNYIPTHIDEPDSKRKEILMESVKASYEKAVNEAANYDASFTPFEFFDLSGLVREVQSLLERGFKSNQIAIILPESESLSEENKVRIKNMLINSDLSEVNLLYASKTCSLEYLAVIVVVKNCDFEFPLFLLAISRAVLYLKVVYIVDLEENGTPQTECATASVSQDVALAD